MVGCANPESGLRLFVQLPDRKRRHASNDSSASEDCKGILANDPVVVRKNSSVTCKTLKSQGFSWSCPVPQNRLWHPN